MTDLRLMIELIRKGDITNLDFLRKGVATIARALIELDRNGGRTKERI